MEYNTQQRKLPLPEYGRSVQNMVDHALTIEDREERQRCANTIVNIMGGMFPQLRDMEDFRHKLWDHLAIMSDFKLSGGNCEEGKFGSETGQNSLFSERHSFPSLRTVYSGLD